MSRSSPISSVLRDRIYRRERGRCFYCGALVKRCKATLDHRTSRSQGGETTIANLVLACRVCNEAKGDRSEQEWLAMPREERRKLVEAKRRQLAWRESAGKE